MSRKFEKEAILINFQLFRVSAVECCPAKRKARCETNFYLVKRDATFCQVFEISRGNFEPQAANVFRNIGNWQERSVERHGTFNWNGVSEDSRIVPLTPVRGKRTREFVSTSGHYMFDLVICKNAVFGTGKFRACWITSNVREQRNSASFRFQCWNFLNLICYR